MIFLTKTARMMYGHTVTALWQDAVAFLLTPMAPRTGDLSPHRNTRSAWHVDNGTDRQSWPTCCRSICWQDTLVPTVSKSQVAYLSPPKTSGDHTAIPSPRSSLPQQAPPHRLRPGRRNENRPGTKGILYERFDTGAILLLRMLQYTDHALCAV